MIPIEMQLFQIGEVSKGLGDGSFEYVILKVDILQFEGDRQLGWDCTNETIGVKTEVGKAFHSSNLRWDRSVHVVLVQEDLLDILEVTNFSGDSTGQVVIVEVKRPQIRQESNLCWDSAIEFVSVNVHLA